MTARNRGGMQIFVKISTGKTIPLAVSISRLSNNGRLHGGMKIFVKTSLEKPCLLPSLYRGCQTMLVFEAACKFFFKISTGKTSPLAVSISIHLRIFSSWGIPHRGSGFCCTDLRKPPVWTYFGNLKEDSQTLDWIGNSLAEFWTSERCFCRSKLAVTGIGKVCGHAASYCECADGENCSLWGQKVGFIFPLSSWLILTCVRFA